MPAALLRAPLTAVAPLPIEKCRLRENVGQHHPSKGMNSAARWQQHSTALPPKLSLQWLSVGHSSTLAPERLPRRYYQIPPIMLNVGARIALVRSALPRELSSS